MKYKNLKRKSKLDIYKINKFNAVWIITFILLALHVYFAVQTSSMGVRISLYESEIINLEKENGELSRNIITLTSLTKLNQVSQSMGFTKIDKMVYLKAGESFARAQ